MVKCVTRESLVFYLAAGLLLLGNLGSFDLWTQEWRWADIVWRMLYSKDYFHPNLAGQAYYDKPLLSYWLMLINSSLMGLNTWALRLPSALSGLLVLFCLRKIACFLADVSVAKLASWMLLSTYYFVFWSRIASADMLNLAGVMLSLLWYYSKRNSPSFLHYWIFFALLSFFCLMKGPVVAVISLIVVCMDVTFNRAWGEQKLGALLLAIGLALPLYFLPFYFAHQAAYSENSLYLVYKENVLRFFQPFDHQDPWYAYFYFLPLYGLPWSVLLFFFRRQIVLKPVTKSQWAFLASTLAIFCFFTLSGSRRSYYILPLLPFVILCLAWMLRTQAESLLRIAKGFYFAFLIWFVCLGPVYFHLKGVQAVAMSLKSLASELSPWPTWSLVMIEGDDRIGFYLQSKAPPVSYRFCSDIKAPEALWQQRPRMLVTRPACLAWLKQHGLPLAMAKVIEIDHQVGVLLLPFPADKGEGTRSLAH